jgi:hypothetical protein
MGEAPKLVSQLVGLALALGAAGCSSLAPFTHELRSQHDLHTEDVGKLQFFTSHTITLRREVESGSRRIERGELRLSRGKTIEEIVIGKHTPGVAVEIGDTHLRVSFEEGTALEFGLRVGRPQPLAGNEPPPSGGFATPPGHPEAFPESPRRFDPDLSGPFYLTTEGPGNQVRFAGKIYEAVEDSFQAHLLIDAEELEQVIENETVLRGRRVSHADRPRRLVPFIKL